MAYYGGIDQPKTLAVIMGGGQGTRLYPLTRDRAKPAVPLAGKYRLVDIPISNCLNSGLMNIFVLTQFKSASLHRHIQATYKFDRFSGGFVEISAAQQGSGDEKFGWYQGTADAVRQNLNHFFDHEFDYVLILSGDQLYRMDYRLLMDQHLATKADITIAAIPVPRSEVAALGILQADSGKRIVRFQEKPKTPELLEGLRMAPEVLREAGMDPTEEAYLGSMGIYVFSRDVLIKALDNDMVDFGKNIIPSAIPRYAVYAYPYRGYWEDIGTIKSFFEANLDLTNPIPKFNLYDPKAPIYTHARYLPASKIDQSLITQSIISEGCIIREAKLHHCVVGIRSTVGSGSELRDCIVMGSDQYETFDDLNKNQELKRPNLGVGHRCFLQNCIVDKNVRIGDDVRITPEGKPSEVKHQLYHIRDGIVVIPKGTIIPSGTKI
ncbi:MAG: glucose-1-phosphate adenylyltransferase [Verrucomicrobiae bacterium]|nr:glucose-1-phosphate adenylyltransferase [Verrucomicrobiae bacterium]